MTCAFWRAPCRSWYDHRLQADSAQAALWRGELKHGNRWSSMLRDRLGLQLELAADDELLLTTSGTDALRIAVAGVAGRARPADVALLPTFTYTATADVLVQLGYSLRFVDVDPWTWTIDPGGLEAAQALTPARGMVCVDTLGNPCDYPALRDVCSRAGVRLVADSAGALGALVEGRPLGTQADAHAFSMSFAKVLSARVLQLRRAPARPDRGGAPAGESGNTDQGLFSSAAPAE